MESWFAGDKAYGSLFVKHCGFERCQRAHQFGPAVRDHYLLHFVASGKGQFFTEGRAHALCEGQLFAIFPDQVTTYRADDRDPWVYGWVGYSGDDAELLTRQAGLSRLSPVATVTDAALAQALLRDMLSDAASLRLGALSALGGLYRFLALLGESAKTLPDERQAYYEKALWFMQGHYERGVTVEEAAKFVGLSRSQLFRVFKQAAGASPKETLTAIRARRARSLLETTNLSAEEVAASVGVSSPARLSIMLKSVYGMTMTQIRRNA